MKVFTCFANSVPIVYHSAVDFTKTYGCRGITSWSFIIKGEVSYDLWTLQNKIDSNMRRNSIDTSKIEIPGKRIGAAKDSLPVAEQRRFLLDNCGDKIRYKISPFHKFRISPGLANYLNQ